MALLHKVWMTSGFPGSGGSCASVDHMTAKKSADWLFREARAIHSYVMMPHSGMPVWSHFLARVWKTWLYESTGGIRQDDVCNRWVSYFWLVRSAQSLFWLAGHDVQRMGPVMSYITLLTDLAIWIGRADSTRWRLQQILKILKMTFATDS